MKPLQHKDITSYVKKNIGTFHSQRIDSLDNLTLLKVLRRKNPYLYRAKNVLTAGEIVAGVVNAYLSSNEETLFGNWLEGLAIEINSKVFDGRKSGINGIDLEFDNEGTRYIVAIKSGPNWGNSSQLAKMKSDFIRAKKTLRTSGSKMEIIAVNGCCYGRDNVPDKGDYYKYCGQSFWTFISGESELYTRLIQPLGSEAKKQNDIFAKAYARVINRFTAEFSKEFCCDDGSIDWQRLVSFNSSKQIIKKKRTNEKTA